jgi:hypothetical protein
MRLLTGDHEVAPSHTDTADVRGGQGPDGTLTEMPFDLDGRGFDTQRASSACEVS